MDRIARVAQLVLGKYNIPSSSFNEHKKFFLKPQNIPYHTNEDYAKLIREKTDWFDNFLKASRDKIMVHSDIPWSGTKSSATGGLKLTRMNILGSSSLKEHAEFMMGLNGDILRVILNLKKFRTIYGK